MRNPAWTCPVVVSLRCWLFNCSRLAGTRPAWRNCLTCVTHVYISWLFTFHKIMLIFYGRYTADVYLYRRFILEIYTVMQYMMRYRRRGSAALISEDIACIATDNRMAATNSNGKFGLRCTCTLGLSPKSSPDCQINNKKPKQTKANQNHTHTHTHKNNNLGSHRFVLQW